MGNDSSASSLSGAAIAMRPKHINYAASRESLSFGELIASDVNRQFPYLFKQSTVVGLLVEVDVSPAHVRKEWCVYMRCAARLHQRGEKDAK